MTNYQLGKIYRLYNDDCNDTYIGSSAQININRRFHRHREFARDKELSKRRYGKIFDTPNYHFEVIEEYPCNSRKELFERERYWTKVLDGCNIVNKNIPICYNDEERVKRMREQQKKYFQTPKGIAARNRSYEKYKLKMNLLKTHYELTSHLLK